jgi:hypothetical protein
MERLPSSEPKFPSSELELLVSSELEFLTSSELELLPSSELELQPRFEKPFPAVDLIVLTVSTGYFMSKISQGIYVNYFNVKVRNKGSGDDNRPQKRDGNEI